MGASTSMYHVVSNKSETIPPKESMGFVARSSAVGVTSTFPETEIPGTSTSVNHTNISPFRVLSMENGPPAPNPGQDVTNDGAVGTISLK